MFDGLHVKSTLTDNRVKYNFFALIYKLYENSNVSISTPMGLTERRRVERAIILQRDFLGPFLGSSTLYTFGKECYTKRSTSYI